MAYADSMKPQLRPTRTSKSVVAVLRDHHGEDLWGLRVCHLTKLPSGTVYPILAKLEELGWVEAHWDDSETTGPRRRLYEISDAGRQHTAELLGSNPPAWIPSLLAGKIGPVTS
jgi:PadR family transcriptional regulator, regulatory protein PadR